MRDLDKELTQHGCGEVDSLLFRTDPERAFAALDLAEKHGADNVIRYALTLFEDPTYQPRKPAKATNLHGAVTECATCGGDRFVEVQTRPVVQTVWMEERGITPREDQGYEEMAACPDCNPVDTSHWRYDGTRAQALDPARVRELISRGP